MVWNPAITDIAKDGEKAYIHQHILYCPKCGNRLYTHGTYTRTVTLPDERKIKNKLRVMYCRLCKRTHREIPAWAVPGKNRTLDAYVSAFDECKNYENDDCFPNEDVLWGKVWNEGFQKMKAMFLSGGLIDEKALQSTNVRQEAELLIGTALKNNVWKQQWLRCLH